jgi:hypothetical protein
MTMENWLEEINSEMAGIGEFTDSKDELDPRTDEIVGTMSDDLKKLYTLLQKARGVVEDYIAKINFNLSEKELEKVYYEIKRLSIKAAIIRELFICSARDSHGLWKYSPRIGVRRGFIITVPIHYKEKAEKIIEKISELIKKWEEDDFKRRFSSN